MTNVSEINAYIKPLISMLECEYITQHDIFKRNHTRSIMNFYDNISIAVVNNNKERVLEYIFYDSMEPYSLKKCFKHSISKKYGMVHYVNIINELKIFISN